VDNALLTVRNLSASYGAAKALEDISIEVRRGEFVTIIGANGAGKTTLFKSLMGIIVAQGAIVYDGQDLLRERACRRAGLGIGYVPEGRRVFPNLSVEENLRVGAFRARSGLRDRLQRTYTIFPRLAERRTQVAASLSGGEQQMLAVGRALIADPALLIIDEMSLGLAPLVVDQLFEVLAELHRGGTTILLAEQNAHKALHAADRAYVIETGHIALEGPAEKLRGDPRIVDAYIQALVL